MGRSPIPSCLICRQPPGPAERPAQQVGFSRPLDVASSRPRVRDDGRLQMTKTLGALLDDLAEYPGLPDTACRSLPREAYTSPELHALEVTEIFEKSWLCVGREEYVAKPGDFYTIYVMGEPVIIVRGRDGEVRALNAVCRHRGMLVAQGRGNVGRFV